MNVGESIQSKTLQTIIVVHSTLPRLLLYLAQVESALESRRKGDYKAASVADITKTDFRSR